MSNPTYGNNLHGVLVVASSGSTSSGDTEANYNELGLAIGSTVTNTNYLTSNNISLPSRAQTVICLVQLSSGSANITLDKTSDGTTPTFASAGKDLFQVTHGEPIFLSVTTSSASQSNTNGVIVTTSVDNVVALQIQNVSGATLTLQKLRLIAANVYGDLTAWYDDRTGFMARAIQGDTSVDDTGTFALNT